MKRLLFLIATLIFATPAFSQSVEGESGYFDLSLVESIFQQETTLEVNVRGALLRMAAEAARIEDDDLADMLLKLRAIQVRGYSLDDDEVENAKERVNGLARRLGDAGWERVVRVREGDEYVEMMMQSTGDRIDGMVVFVMNAGANETVFVNIIGEIHPEDISRIGRKFRIRVLDSM